MARDKNKDELQDKQLEKEFKEAEQEAKEEIGFPDERRNTNDGDDQKK